MRPAGCGFFRKAGILAEKDAGGLGVVKLLFVGFT